MAMEIINGKEIAEKILNNIKDTLRSEQKKPVLTIVFVGEDEGSKVYVERKKISAEQVGVVVNIIKLAEAVAVEEIKSIIKEVATKSSGVILQLPLPEKIKHLTDEIIASIPTEQDVDCLRLETLELASNNQIDWQPPIVEAVDSVLAERKVDLANKNICLIGRGRVTGLPISQVYKKRNYNVLIVDKDTLNANSLIANADVIISATGQAHVITSEKVKDGALIIDAGFARKDGKIVGDVDNKSFENRQVVICPSPGGVGPITVATLLLNVVKACKK